jgi:hypothetical protein
MAAFRGDMTPAFGPGTRSSGARHHSKSSRVGPARDADGQPTTAYRALERLACGPCGGEIAVGALFLRRTVAITRGHGLGSTQAPVCARCSPLTVIGGEQEDG